MDKLAEVTIDNSLNVTVNCQVDQSLLAKNFITIVDALKELQKAQALSDQKIADLSSLKGMIEALGQRMDKVEKDISDNFKHSTESKESKEAVGGSGSNSGDYDRLASNLDTLSKKVEKNEANILDNIKDINLINSDLKDAKIDIQDLKNRFNLIGSSA